MLRSGLEESSRYLTQARVELLDPERRRILDEELAEEAHQESIVEFQKYLAFALGNHVLRTDDERHLITFGTELGLKEDEMVALIETELRDSGAKRIDPDEIGKTQESNGAAKPSLNKDDDFMRMLRLSGLDSDAMTDDQRDAFHQHGRESRHRRR